MKRLDVTGNFAIIEPYQATTDRRTKWRFTKLLKLPRVMKKSKRQQSPRDGAARQAKFKEQQRKEGRRRMELWVTDEERAQFLECLEKVRK